MVRQVVTGGAGFIGSHIAEALAARRDEVIAFDNLSTGHRKNVASGEGVRLVEGDIRDAAAMTALFRGADTVFHQAALPSVPRSVQDPWTSHDHNANGTLQVLLAARAAGVRRVVYAGSSSVYGNTPQLPRVETMAPAPASPYAVAKHIGELYCRVFRQIYGLETVALRYFNVFGPRQDPASQYAAVIPKFMAALRRGEPPSIHGDGEQTRDFTYVANVVAANLAAASAPAERVAGRVFNVGSGEAVSVNRLLAELQAILGTRLEPVRGPPRSGDVRHSLAGIEAAREAFGYRPAVMLRRGLQETVTWSMGKEA